VTLPAAEPGQVRLVGVDSGRAISFVTLGTRDLSTLRSFYRSWGWTERDGGDDEFAQFDAGGVRLALYPLGLLRDEAAPDSELPPSCRCWPGTSTPPATGAACPSTTADAVGTLTAVHGVAPTRVERGSSLPRLRRTSSDALAAAGQRTDGNRPPPRALSTWT